MQNRSDKNNLHLFEAGIERLKFYKENASECYKSFATNYLMTIVYLYMFLQASKTFADKKQIKEIMNQVIDDYKKDNIEIKSKFKVWLRI